MFIISIIFRKKNNLLHLKRTFTGGICYFYNSYHPPFLLNTASAVPLKRFIDPSLLFKVFVVGSMTVGVKLVAFAKELVVAHRFGTSDEVDAFLIALLIPTLLAFIVGDAFRDALIPAYSERRLQSERAGERLVSNLLWMSLAALLLLSVGVLLFSRPLIELIASNFGPEKLGRTRELLFLVIPFAAAFGLSRVLQGVLQANDRFSLSSAAPVAIPATIIAVLLFTPGIKNAALLAIGNVVGAILLVVVLILSANRNAARPLLQRPGCDSATRTALRHTAPLLAGALLYEGCYFVDTLMAASLPAGSVAVLGYGERICKFALTVGGTTAGFVLFPHISDLAAREEWVELKQVSKRFCVLLLTASLPMVGLFWYAAEPIVRLLLERGEFTSDDTRRVAAVLQFAGFQVPGYILTIMASKMVLALKGGRFLLLSTIFTLGLNVVLNLAFIPSFGVKGIALSTAVVSLTSAIVLFLYFRYRVRQLEK